MAKTESGKKGADAEGAHPDAEAAPAPKAPKGPIILVLLNTLAILAAAGTFVYTQVLFKRPPITESKERSRLEKEVADTKAPNPTASPVDILIESFTANVGSSALPPGTKATALVKGKPHYITVGFIMVIRDSARVEDFNKIKPKFMDNVLQLLGKKTYQELNSVQGRYVLRSNFVDLANKLLKEPLIKTVWFTDFVVQ